MQNTIIFNPDHIFEFRLATRFGWNLFPDGFTQTDGSRHQNYSDARTKIVIKNWWPYLDSSRLEKQDLSWADLLVCYTTEVITGPWQKYEDLTIQQFNNPNFICLCNGTYRLPDYPKKRVYSDMLTWFSQTAYYCYYEPWMQNKNKLKIFDALMGQARPNRIFLLEKLIESDLLDKTLTSIHGSKNYRSPELSDLEPPSVNQYFKNSIISAQDPMPGFTNGRHLGEYIPIDVYRNSWYSIVTETNGHDSDFLTEKTAKPLLLKRLFIMLGSQGLLAKLKSCGFETFHDVVDESYDQEENAVKRWEMAFEQIKQLSKANHYLIYKKILPILNHNQNQLLNYRKNFQETANFISNYVENLH
jgi:hypothetical protein